MIATENAEPTTQQTKSEQLRHCADWLDENDVRGSVLVSTGNGQPKLLLNLDDLRRCFAGAIAKQKRAEYVTTYSLEAEGILFEANDYGRAEFQVTETEVTL